MRIKKLGHSCLVIIENDKKILIDPGKYSTLQNEEMNIDIILITHEHSDHFHFESIKTLLGNNPSAKIFTNASVGAILEKEGILSSTIEDGQEITINDRLLIKGVGELHQKVHEVFPTVKDVGFLINHKFFYPGDAFHNPNEAVEIVAFPVVGSWLKISEVVGWLKELKPKIVIPVHDAIINEHGQKGFLGGYQKILTNLGIELKILEIGKEYEF